MLWWYILYFIIGIIILSLLIVASYYIHSYLKWFLFLKDYQKVSNCLDRDILLLKQGKIEEVQLREKTTEEIIENFFIKYPKKLN
jgi:Na+-transporting NADH:ubiquinone oxidoreductase subunit NqrC